MKIRFPILCACAVMLLASVRGQQSFLLSRVSQFANSSDTNPPSPANVSGLRVWFRPEDLNGSVGDAIGSWTDYASGISATNPTAAQKPYLTNSAPNGLNAIYMDGGDILQLESSANSILNAKGGVTVIGVVRRNSESSGAKSWFHFARNSSGSTRFYPYLNGTNITGGGRRLDTDGFQSFGSTIPTGTGWFAHEANGDYANTIGIVALNSVPVHTNAAWLTAGTTSATDSANVRIGGVATGSESWVGWVAEIMVYDRAISPADRGVISNYLSSKYGL